MARTATILVALLTMTLPLRAADPGIDFFENKIRPILVEHCYKCHSVEAKKDRGGLHLDSKAAIRKGGDTGPAIAPGKPADSLLLKAVRYEKLKMPPKGKLPDAAIADLEKWIALGAPDPREDIRPVTVQKTVSVEEGRKFWAYQPPKRHAPPAVQDTAWPRSDIDRFVLAKLEAKGLKPVADAEPRVLIRRLYFDLIGLPPTAEEVEEFVQQSSGGLRPRLAAIERVVDRLLASPHFGERWGRHWLDVARYADSTGGGRSMLLPEAWRYRDYVIGSFNQDKPYDRFVREQIAGDLLGDPPGANAPGSPALTALAFLVLGPTNYERQDKDALEMDVIDEQLDTMGRAFLGMTIGCARCHDHKFDPIPTKDYYALAGIFKSSQTLIHDNVSKWVEAPLPTSPEQAAELKQYNDALAELREKLKRAQAKAGPSTPAPAAKGIVAVKDLPGILLDDAQAKKVGQWMQSQFNKTYIGDGYLHDNNMGQGDKTLTFVPEFPKAGKYEVRLAYTPATNRASKVPVTVLHLDGEQTFHVNQKENPPIDGRFVSIGSFRFDTNGQWFVMISNDGADGHVIVDAVQLLPADEAAEKKPEPKPAAKPVAGDDVKTLEAQLKQLQAKAPVMPTTMAVRESAKIGDAKICIRGNHLNLGEPAPRGFLQVATPPGLKIDIPAKESGRRQLADWLASSDNPLTARVMTNRVWHWLLGAGIVRTVDIFGVTGELPSHPELLDYLALRYVEHGWSTKKLIREIVLSRAYQLSSENQKEGLTADPENRLLWRMNRRRLEAEQIRDTMLVVSGKLDRGMGGPTIRKGTGSEYGYVFDDYRRSVYTPILRNRLHELFEAFDFPDPNLSAGRRNVSTVATQALYLLNNPFVLEQAKLAAQRALADGRDDPARIDHAYRTAIGRPPTEKEKAVALQFITSTDANGRGAAWERFYQALFACVDFRYVN